MKIINVVNPYNYGNFQSYFDATVSLFLSSIHKTYLESYTEYYYGSVPSYVYGVYLRTNKYRIHRLNQQAINQYISYLITNEAFKLKYHATKS